MRFRIALVLLLLVAGCSNGISLDEKEAYCNSFGMDYYNEGDFFVHDFTCVTTAEKFYGWKYGVDYVDARESEFVEGSAVYDCCWSDEIVSQMRLDTVNDCARIRAEIDLQTDGVALHDDDFFSTLGFKSCELVGDDE